MERLKHKHIFHGKTAPFFTLMVDFIIITAVFIMVNPVLNENLFIPFAVGSALLIFISLVINYILIHRLTPKEKEKIAMSSPPEWKSVTDDMKSHFKASTKIYIIAAICILFAEVIVAVDVYFQSMKTEYLIATLLLSVPVTIIGFSYCGIVNYMWANMDDSATYTIVNVDHCYTTKEHRGNGTRVFTYVVFYLPDGKYVLICKKNTDIPEQLIIFKYKFLIRWDNARSFIDETS